MVSSQRWRVFKGLLTRLIFVAHGIVSFYLLYNKNNLQLIHLLLIIPLAFLIIEGVITLRLRSGKEAKYFWPCGFFYIMTIVPIIWILEMDLLSQRQTKRNSFNTTISANGGKIKSEKDLFSYVVGLADEVDGRKVAEIGVIIVVIFGRWMSPRASMSREQLSNLLLGYVANAADILELFESLKSPTVIYASDVTIGVLAVYTWSLLQFTLITTATYDNNKSDSKCDDDDSAGRRITPTHSMSTHTPKDQNTSSSITVGYNKGCYGHCLCHPEFFVIFVTLLMQDGPFLILRISLCVIYKVTAELHIFFLCKNGIVCILLIYRSLILGSQQEKLGFVNDDGVESVNNRANNDIEVQDIGLDNPVVEKVEKEKKPLLVETRDVGTDNPIFDFENDETKALVDEISKQ